MTNKLEKEITTATDWNKEKRPMKKSKPDKSQSRV